MTTAISIDTAVQAATSIGPVIREHAARAEQERHLPDEVVDALIEAGVFRFFVPESLGGLEGDPVSFYRMVEALGAVDGSTAWCSFIGGAASVVGQYLSDEAATEIFSDPRAIVAGGVWPFHPAQPENGGYRVNGQWAYASGCWHSTYLAGGVMVMDGDQPRSGPNGAPELRVAAVPREAVEILDTWDVMGLAGTGSHDIAMRNLLVPEGFTAPLQPGAPKGSHYQGPVFRFPFLGLFALPMSAVALGIAQGAIDFALDLAQNKVPALSQSSLRERELFQIQIAEAVADTASARAWLYQLLEDVWTQVQDGQEVSLEQRNQMNLAASHATKSARTAVETTYLACGGTANYNKSPLPRAMRDIHALSQHVATSPQQFQFAGRLLAGLPPANPLILI